MKVYSEIPLSQMSVDAGWPCLWVLAFCAGVLFSRPFWRFLGPRIDPFWQFLGPEIAKKDNFLDPEADNF